MSLLASQHIPQANDPSRVVALCRHWNSYGVDTWPDDFKDGRDRSYYRHALELLAAVTSKGETKLLADIASLDAVEAQRAFAHGVTNSMVFARWLGWAGVAALNELDGRAASSFLEAEADLALSTTRRRAGTLRRWLVWATESLPANLTEALNLALSPIELHSRNAHKFDAAKQVLARQLGLCPKQLAIKLLTDRKNYGNRISEATRIDPSALILVSTESVDLAAVSRDFGSRALTRPPSLIVERHQGGWRGVEVIEGDERKFDPFPRSLPRRRVDRPILPGPDVSDDEVEEAVELLVALQDQPIAVLDAIKGELPPRLRDLCQLKRVSSSRQAHNRLAEALGQRPRLLVLVAPTELIPTLERALEQAPMVGANEVRVLFALHDEERFSVLEPEDARPEPVASPPCDPGFSARRIGKLDWRKASYLSWNERLLDYVFAADETSAPVTRVAANPEELKRAVDDPMADPAEVAAAFAEVFRHEVPPGRSLDRKLTDHSPVPPDEIPDFFGLLWMTCLICWGYPQQNEGSFETRLREVLDRRTNYQRLDDAWVELDRWLKLSTSYRDIELPEPDAFRSRIGRSYFLAFPHGRDRLRLAEVLSDVGLSGRHLPVPTALQVLVDNRSRFSRDFRSDLDEFRKRWAEGEEPAKSAFWRAVQQEAMRPSHDTERGKPRATLVAREEDELLQPLLAWPRSVEVPSAMQAESDPDLEDLHADLLSDRNGDPSSAAEHQLENPTLLDASTKAAIRQGVLLFTEVDDWEYRPVDGDVSATSAALVRKDLVASFRGAFGGRIDECGASGWRAIIEPQVKALLEPPEGLEGVDQLCISAAPPRPQFTGGIRAPGGHLWAAGCPPRVRAVGADTIEAEFCGSSGPCVHAGDGIWDLPRGLVDEDRCPADLVIRARWEVRGPDDSTLTRHGTTKTRLWRTVVGWTYKPPPGSRTTFYWLEGVVPAMRSVTGGSPIDLGLTTRDAAEAADLIEFDSSAIFLGPGCGEVSATRDGPVFDWMAIGPSNNPEWVIFVGDPDDPSAHDNGYSTDKSARRWWKRSFGNTDKSRIRVHTSAGYEPLERFPDVELEFERRLASTRQRTLKACREVTPDSRLKAAQARQDEWKPRALSRGLWEAIDQVAAISLRRKGVSGKAFQSLMLELTSCDDYLLANQVRRAWAEMGAVDVLRRQDHGNLVVVARRPRFLMVRDGPRILGLLQGLVPQVLDEQLGAIAKQMGLEHDHRPRVCSAWTPPLPLVWVESASVLRTLSQRLDLADPMWMRWPTEGPPKHLDATRTALKLTDRPGYTTDAVWDWEAGYFSRRNIGTDGAVRVTRLRHVHRPPVYVVDADGTTGWSRSRNWALLEASRHRLEAPFIARSRGTLVSTGAAPVHLPLPIARLCSILGDACPGPQATSSSGLEYHYPYGDALWRTLEPLLPTHWTKNESD